MNSIVERVSADVVWTVGWSHFGQNSVTRHRNLGISRFARIRIESRSPERKVGRSNTSLRPRPENVIFKKNSCQINRSNWKSYWLQYFLSFQLSFVKFCWQRKRERKRGWDGLLKLDWKRNEKGSPKKGMRRQYFFFFFLFLNKRHSGEIRAFWVECV